MDENEINESNQLVASVNSEEKELLQRKESGAIAQKNGAIFESKIVEIFEKDLDKRNQIIEVFCYFQAISRDEYDFDLVRVESNKVEDFLGGKTTAKADLSIIAKNKLTGDVIKKGISLKMTHNTQLQICSFEKLWKFINHAKFNMPENIELLKLSFEKFLGINSKTPQESLSSEDVNFLKENRIHLKIKGATRKLHPKFYSFELSEEENDSVVSFLKNNIYNLLSFGFKSGFCQNREDHADYILYNLEDYTKTKKIDFKIDSMDNYLKKLVDSIVKENSFETDSGNYQLGSSIGIQMKGSGNETSYHNIQFKIRKIIE